MGSFRQPSNKSAAVPPATTAAPGRVEAILYDPRLIDALLRDHAELGRLFTQLGAVGKTGNLGEARSLLLTFQARLKAHVVAENVRFYDYLEQSLAHEPETLHVVRTYRRKMVAIGRTVFAFVQKYQTSTFTPGERRQFAADYETVGAALESRLDNEEDNLYRLYRPF
ncbi:MAG: hemerythrin domain-containing protein [Rhodanobacteraceae bacterium]|nr:MAG: hemerythrin domain-containing protein [Rhodanobacteraceae bacterium]